MESSNFAFAPDLAMVKCNTVSSRVNSSCNAEGSSSIRFCVSSKRSSCSGEICSAALAAAALSRMERSSHIWLASSLRIPATTTPQRGICSTYPSDCKVRKASRIGVRLEFIKAASCTSRNLYPDGNNPTIIADLSLLATTSAVVREQSSSKGGKSFSIVASGTSTLLSGYFRLLNQEPERLFNEHIAYNNTSYLASFFRLT